MFSFVPVRADTPVSKRSLSNVNFDPLCAVRTNTLDLQRLSSNVNVVPLSTVWTNRPTLDSKRLLSNVVVPRCPPLRQIL